MGGSGEQSRRPIALPRDVLVVKCRNADAELLRLAADLVQRGEPVVNIEGGILQSLGHDRPGALLELENEMRVLRARFFIQVFRKTKEQDVAQEIEDRFFDRRVAALGRRDRSLDDRAIVLAHRFSGRDVGSINRETGDRFANCAIQRIEGEIAEPAILLPKAIEHVAEDVDVVRERRVA